MTSGVADLTAGPHQVRVRFQERSDGGPHMYLFWTPPGGARQVIPGAGCRRRRRERLSRTAAYC